MDKSSLGGSENPTIAWFAAVIAAAAVSCVPMPAAYVLAALTLLVMTAVALVPWLPWHAAALGFTIEIVYFLAQRLVPFTRVDSVGNYVFLTVVTIFATFVTASRHARRTAWVLAKQDAIRSAEALTGAQLRAQLAENAISIGKMAAGLSHEINSPLGALRSSIQTLAAIAARDSDAPEAVHELFTSLQQSAARIDQVAQRLRRFATLEDAELKSANVNELLTDVTQIFASEIDQRKVRVDFDLERSLP